MWKTTASRLSAALLGYILLIIIFLTLNPFLLAVPAKVQLAFQTTLGDFLANIALFLPVGFLFRLTGGGRRGAFLLGAITSFGIESLQVFMPARTPSFQDFACNSLGSFLGAVLYDVLSSHLYITPRAVGRLRLETPLMGFLYLLVPLLWANGLAVRENSSRWLLTALIGICGAIVMGDVFQQWWAPKRTQIAIYAALSAVTWFLIGSGPALLKSYAPLIIGFVVALFAAVLTYLPRTFPDRRFEQLTLRRLVLVFVLYLLLLAIWHPLSPLGSWHAMFGFTARAADTSLQGIYHRIEYLAAFTVLGYVVAEWRGRSELRLAQDFPRLLTMAAIIATILEVLIGFKVGSGASLIRLALVLISALYGGMLYHLLRAHIRFLLERNEFLAGGTIQPDSEEPRVCMQNRPRRLN